MLNYFVILFALVASVLAKTSGGDFAVTINGQVFNPPQDDELKLDKQNTPVRGTILFRGIHVNFDFSTTNFVISNYTLTGAPNDLRIVNKPTQIFASKTPALSAAQLANPRMTRLEIKDDKVVLIIDTNAGSYKIQAIDSAQGGALQTEPEFGGSIEITHVLGPTVFYFLNEFTGKVNFGDGIDAVPKSQDPVNYHDMLLGKDSPEAATQTYQDGSTSKWVIQSGGRVGAVFGEDAIEESPGSGQCTSHCQNRDRIHGSVPVPSDPVNPTPLASPSSPASPSPTGAARVIDRASRGMDRIDVLYILLPLAILLCI